MKIVNIFGKTTGRCQPDLQTFKVWHFWGVYCIFKFLFIKKQIALASQNIHEDIIEYLR